MPKFNVSKSKVINAPIDKVFNTLNNYNTWRSWSPWLITEPEADLDIAEDGKSYSWIGRRIGSGEMSIASESENKQIKMDLTFLKPWKSHAKTDFVLKEVSDGTEVTWNMDSSLPFFMFWMKNQMVNMIGNDYNRGLSMLKEILEEGKLHSKLEFLGTSDFSGYQYIGINTETSMTDMGTNMSSDFTKMWEYMGDKMDTINGKPFSIYHKWDMSRGKVIYTVGVPVSSGLDNLPEGFMTGNIRATKVYTIRHIGRYHHLGNAWSALYGLSRSKDVKAQKSIHPFEVYENDPSNTKPEDLITDLKFAVK